MSETTTPPVPVKAPAPLSRGYFNQNQIDDIALAESVCASALANKTTLAAREIDDAFLARIRALIEEAQSRTIHAATDADDSKDASEQSSKAAAALYSALQAIQSAAKQKHRMLAIDGDPTTNFSTAGYLIGSRLNASRASLLQNAATLIVRMEDDNLPGYKTPESIQAVRDLLFAYRDDQAAQTQSTQTKEISRLDRDDLLDLLNNHRSAIQHAADAIWPWSTEANRPIRKAFSLPLNRPLGL